MSFEGFGQTTTFLRNLGRNNSKEWFHAHYDDYQEHLLEPAMAFVEAIGPLLRRFAPDTQAVPKIGASVMRINRDIRFSADIRRSEAPLPATPEASSSTRVRDESGTRLRTAMKK